MSRIGYARVSTADQDLDTQRAKLKAEGCEIVRSEKVSGGSRDGRTELATVLEFLRPGDELVVTRLDRLGRDTRDVLNIVHECERRGASVTVLDPHVSTRGEMGHVVLTVLGMVAQMERRFIKERQREGILKARADGVYQGGKRRLDREKIRLDARGGSRPGRHRQGARVFEDAGVSRASGGVSSRTRPCRRPAARERRLPAGLLGRAGDQRRNGCGWVVAGLAPFREQRIIVLRTTKEDG